MVVEEPMAGLGIHLDVMVHPDRRQSPLQPPSGPVAHRGTVLAAIAAHDRAGPGQHLFGVAGAAAVVGAGSREAAVRGQRQGIAAAHAKADHPDPAGAVLLLGQPGPYGLDVVEGPALPGAQLAHDGAQTAQHAAPPVQVGGGGQVALAGQPVGLVAQVLAHAGEVVDDDNARPWPLAGWGRHVGRHLPARGGELRLGHDVLLVFPSSADACMAVRPPYSSGGQAGVRFAAHRTEPGGAGWAWWRPAAGAGPTGVTQPRQRNVARSVVCRLGPTWWGPGCPHPPMDATSTSRSRDPRRSTPPAGCPVG